MKFRRKATVEAIQYDGTNAREVVEWMSKRYRKVGAFEAVSYDGFSTARIVIRAPEGDMQLLPGYWVIQNVEGDFYPAKPDWFAEIYQPAE